MEEPKKKLLQWHPAFYAGLKIELAEDAENLIFENEHLGLGELCRGVKCCIEHFCPLVIDHDGHAGFTLLTIHPAIVGKSDVLHDVVLSI